MAKKQFGKFITLAAVAGAAAAGISYFLRYKSFHKELDEEFHDFEDDFDCCEEAGDNSSTATRSYVSLNPERTENDEDMVDETAKETPDEIVKDTPDEITRETVEDSIEEAADEMIDETIKNTTHEAAPTTTIMEDLTE